MAPKSRPESDDIRTAAALFDKAHAPGVVRRAGEKLAKLSTAPLRKGTRAVQDLLGVINKAEFLEFTKKLCPESSSYESASAAQLGTLLIMKGGKAPAVPDFMTAQGREPAQVTTN